MNQMGQRALEFFQAYPNAAPETDASKLHVRCEEMGQEMTAQAEYLATQLRFRAQEDAKHRTGLKVTDWVKRAAMLRTAQVEAEAIGLAERVYDLLEYRWQVSVHRRGQGLIRLSTEITLPGIDLGLMGDRDACYC